MASALKINAVKLAKLLRARIVEANTYRENKLPVKSVAVYRSLIESYFGSMFKHVVKTGEALSFPFVGDMQVLQVVSKKNYAWDQKYNGKDYKLVIESSKCTVSVDTAWYDKIIKAVDGGRQYSDVVSNPSERLNEILNLLEHGKTTRVSQRRRDKIAS